MTRRLFVGPIAEHEVVGAARWYEARELGLGSAFVNAALRTLDVIEREPENVPSALQSSGFFVSFLAHRFRQRLC